MTLLPMGLPDRPDRADVVRIADEAPPQLCRHCERALVQVSVPDGPQPIRLHVHILQSRCAPSSRHTAYPAPMSLVDGTWMTERQARESRGLPTDPVAVATEILPVEIVLPAPRPTLRRDIAAAG
jgi:hypothetical protein